MSKFPEQLALVSVLALAAVGGSVWQYERVQERAAEAEALAAVERAAAAERAAAEEAEVAAAEPAPAEPAPAEPNEQDMADAEPAAAPEPATQSDTAAAEPPATDTDTAAADPHGHGDAGTAPIASVIAGAAVAQTVDSPAIDATGVEYGLGRPALDEEVAAWDIDVRPDGTGLPEGAGDVWTGEQVFIEKCAVCHGDFAEGVGRWPVLAGGLDSLTDDRPEKTVGSFWPYLSTAYDYIHRAMPFGESQSLTPDETYAIIAYLLYSNWLVEDDFELSHENFTEVRLPNEDGFFMDDRDETEVPAFTGEPCMEGCKEAVEITMRAVVLDVTPDDPTDDAALGPTEAAAVDVPEPDAPAAEDGGATDASAEADAAPAEEGPALDPELVAAGETAFRQCKACHMIGEGASHRVGPELNDVIGRTAGTADGFRYSGVMADAGEEGLVWTAETIHDFLSDPRGYLRGTRMSFAGFRDEGDIDAVIAYLQSHSQ